jgi:phytoene dehydrogenase-like protein
MYDVAVVGAGFGGLSAALRAQELGGRTVLFEALNYPGGCASTFQRGGARYESGATLFSGFAPDGLMTRWVQTYSLPVEFQPLNPMVTLRSSAGSLRLGADRDDVIRQLCNLAPGHAAGIRGFFALQRLVADALWPTLNEPRLLPPFNTMMLKHLRALPAYLHIATLAGRRLGQVIARYGLQDCEPFMVMANAVCQITVQTSANEAETPIALSAMDYFYRGTGHIRGGIGMLSTSLVEALRAGGADVRMPDRVRALRRVNDGWEVESRSTTIRARHVVANVLPAALRELLAPEFSLTPRVTRLQQQVEAGWGACMLYLQLVPDGGEFAHHLQLIGDTARPFLDGNHVFVSMSGASDGARGPDGVQTATVSTHVAMAGLRESDEAATAARVEAIQQQMRATIAVMAPEVEARILRSMPGSPRTFARFTRRSEGLVGGIPRRASLSHYRDLWPAPVAPGLWLVGDSVFPGQSTLACAVGGHRVVDALAGQSFGFQKRIAGVATSTMDAALTSTAHVESGRGGR